MTSYDYSVTYRAFGVSDKQKEWPNDLAWMIRRLDPERRPDVIRSGIPGLLELLPEAYRDIPIDVEPNLAMECWFGYRD